MKIFIDRIAYEKMYYWIQKADKEVSGLGIVEIVKGDTFVKDVLLLKQENSSTETEIKGEDICKAMYEFNKAGQKGDIKFWWHSHVNMAVEWSNTDYECMDKLSQHGWFVNAVFNKRCEYRAAFSDASLKTYNKSKLDIKYEVFQDELDLVIVDNISAEMYKDWDKQFDDKVTETVYQPVYQGKYDRWNPTTGNWDWEDDNQDWGKNWRDDTKINTYEELSVGTEIFFCNSCSHTFKGPVTTDVCVKCCSNYIEELDEEYKALLGAVNE